MFNFDTLLVCFSITCPCCGHELNNGDVMYRDTDRLDVICGYCMEDYKYEVISEEGIDGRLLK